MTLSKKAILLSNNHGLQADYLFDPLTDPHELSDQFKMLSWKALHMVSATQQACLDKMMPILGVVTNNHFIAVAKCDTPGCDSESQWSSGTMPKDARVVFTKFRNRGWQASRKKMACPTCVKHSKQKPVTEFKRERPMKPIGEALRKVVAVDLASPAGDKTIELHAHVQPDNSLVIDHLAEGAQNMTTVTATATSPTDKARAAKRLAYDLLLAHYDVAAKRYEGDWSDKRISDESKLSEAKVASIRDEDFGPAGPPPQLIDLKARITAIEAKLRDKETQVLKAMDELPQLQEEVKLCQSQLKSLIQAHGWSE